ncbi:hypothetical protein Syun_014162 [Stephania yunnanensis]|uniref:Uncharacterized protein n=1 Tax=Stephania yunnanensis TaxID=152371 RepID=A0AAP0JIZ8_9MAGN
MVTMYLRYELLSGRYRYLPIECKLGALIRVRRYLIVERVRVGRHGARPKPEVRVGRLGARPKPESSGLLPRLNDFLVGTPCYLASLIDGLFTVLYIHAFLISFHSICMNSTALDIVNFVLDIVKCCVYVPLDLLTWARYSYV